VELNDELLGVVAGDKRFCRHFHIPLQSGSDRILASMRRRYNREFYRDLVLKTAALIPGSAFTADVMVGYPTENEADFQDTYDLIHDLPIYELHVFKYSRRIGTSATDLFPQVEAVEKQSRSEALLELGRKKKIHFQQGFVGQKLAVLVERKVSDDIFAGISDNYIEVYFPSLEDLLGKFVEVTLTELREDHGIGFI
jgi:threonylcarbamoyladenosine tRNA methylthiotransferase MtaB